MRSLPEDPAEMPRSRKQKPSRAQTKDANANSNRASKSKTSSNGSSKPPKPNKSKLASSRTKQKPAPVENLPPIPKPKHRRAASHAVATNANVPNSHVSRPTVARPLPVRRIQSSSSSSSILTNTPNSFTPITAHYALNQTLYQAFYKLYEKKHFKTALSVGIQFCRVALWDITQHSYYNSTSQKYVDLKIESARCAVYVSDLLPHVLKKARQMNDYYKSNADTSPSTQQLKEDQDKEEEVLMLKEVAKDHYHYITEEQKAKSSGTAPKSNTAQSSLQSLSYSQQQKQKQKSSAYQRKEVKKEVLEVDDGYASSWLRVLECGNTRMTLCPPSISPSPTYSQELETVVEDGKGAAIQAKGKKSSSKDKSKDEKKDSKSSSKKSRSANRAIIDDDEDDGATAIAVVSRNGTHERRNQAQKQGHVRRRGSSSEDVGVEQKASSSSLVNDRLKNRYGMSPVDFTRTTSAPAHLGPGQMIIPPSSSSSRRSSGKNASKTSSGRTSNNERTKRGKQRRRSSSSSHGHGHGHRHRQRKVQPARSNTQTRATQQLQEEREPVEDENRYASISDSTASTEEEDVVDLDVYPTQSNMSGDASANDGVIYVDTMKSKEEMQYEADLERALYLSGIEIQQSTSVQSATDGTDQDHGDARYKHLKPVDSDIIGMDTLSTMYKNDFEDLRKNQMIQVEYLDTYQGRVRESVNGCTVIAPLLAIHHLCDEKILSERNSILSEGKDNNSTGTASSTIEDSKHTESEGSDMDIGIDNNTIRTVIDIQAPLILPQVRGNLGLHQDALIIPADVHDYLIEQNFLTQNQFAGVYGGNILDDDHIKQFIDSLCNFDKEEGSSKANKKIDQGESSRKVAATFFFHEHVVALHRITRKIDTNVDSLDDPKNKKSPSRNPFRRMRLRRKKKAKDQNDVEDIKVVEEEEMWFEIIDSLPGASMLTYDDYREEDLSYTLSNTARIRCNSAKSLQACFRWYACSKFTESDKKFINSYQWDDMNMEFDPRVFQAFVWSN